MTMRVVRYDVLTNEIAMIARRKRGPARAGVANADTFQGRFAQHLRSLRERKGLSALEFSRRISELTGRKMGPSGTYQWENGTIQPRLKVLPAIAEVLGVKIRQLIPNE